MVAGRKNFWSKLSLQSLNWIGNIGLEKIYTSADLARASREQTDTQTDGGELCVCLVSGE